MAETPAPQLNSDNLEPLGLKNPLLPSQPLGQNFLQPKFLVPLGARSLSILNPSIFLSHETADYSLPEVSFEDSPFFNRSRSSQPVQPKSEVSSASREPKLSDSTVVQTVQTVLETEVSDQKQESIVAEEALPILNSQGLESSVEKSVIASSQTTPSIQAQPISPISLSQQTTSDTAEPAKPSAVPEATTSVPIIPEQPSADISSPSVNPSIVQAASEALVTEASPEVAKSETKQSPPPNTIAPSPTATAPQVEAKTLVSKRVETPDLSGEATPTESEIVQPLAEGESLHPSSSTSVETTQLKPTVVTPDSEVNSSTTIERSPEKIPTANEIVTPSTAETTSSVPNQATTPQLNLPTNLLLPTTPTANLSREPSTFNPSETSPESIVSNPIVQPQSETAPQTPSGEQKSARTEETSPISNSLFNLQSPEISAKVCEQTKPTETAVVQPLLEGKAKAFDEEIPNTENLKVSSSTLNSQISESAIEKTTDSSGETRHLSQVSTQPSEVENSPPQIEPLTTKSGTQTQPTPTAKSEENFVSPKLEVASPIPSSEPRDTAQTLILPESVSPPETTTPSAVLPEAVPPTENIEPTSDSPEPVTSLGEKQPNLTPSESISLRRISVKTSIIQPRLETEASQPLEVESAEIHRLSEPSVKREQSANKLEETAQPTPVEPSSDLESREAEKSSETPASTSTDRTASVPKLAIDAVETRSEKTSPVSPVRSHTADITPTLEVTQPTEPTQVADSEPQHPATAIETVTVDSTAATSAIALGAIASTQHTVIQPLLETPAQIPVEEPTSTKPKDNSSISTPEISEPAVESATNLEPVTKDESLLPKPTTGDAIAPPLPTPSDAAVNQALSRDKCKKVQDKPSKHYLV